MAVKDLRDSDKNSAKNVNPQKGSPTSTDNAKGKQNMPCKNSLPT